MTETYTNTIARIANEFVQDVAITMINEAVKLSTNDLFVKLVEEYGERQIKENREYMRDVTEYMQRYQQNLLATEPKHWTCLTHANSYKTVIVDILQGKCKL